MHRDDVFRWLAIQAILALRNEGIGVEASVFFFLGDTGREGRKLRC